MKILLTGANGFIGRKLYDLLLAQNHLLCCVFRKQNQFKIDRRFESAHLFFIDDLSADTNWDNAFDGVDVVVHMAALAHMKPKTDLSQHKRFLSVNYEGTVVLAAKAADNGVKRFVFISSIGVVGKVNHGNAFSEKDIEHPHNSYTIAKFKAEQSLKQLEKKTGMEIVIIRPPLVYGPNVKANFLKLLRLVHKNVPLPFAGMSNKRSFVALENLVDAVSLCIRHKNAGGKTFIVSDGNALSTETLVRKIAAAMGKAPLLFPLPEDLVKFLLVVAGKESIYERLWGSLSVDTARIKRCLGWQPVISTDHAIEKTVNWFLKHHH